MLRAFDFFFRDMVNVSAFGEELSNETVGVFVDASFPRTLRMSKTHVHLSILGKEFIGPEGFWRRNT